MVDSQQLETVAEPKDRTLLVCVTVMVLGVCGAVAYVGPKFAPQPTPAPVVPGGNLASLVPEAEARSKLAAYYREWAQAVADPKFPLRDTVQVSNALRFSANHFESSERLPPMAQLRDPIQRKIEYAIGKENRPIDDDSRGDLATVLGQIADDFGG